MNDQEQERPIEFTIQLPPELEGGIYANHLGVWHTPYEFTLDFGATQIPRVLEPDDLDSAVEIRSRVVARIRVPVTLLFDMIRILHDDLTSYERQLGEIRRPGEGTGS